MKRTEKQRLSAERNESAGLFQYLLANQALLCTFCPLLPNGECVVRECEQWRCTFCHLPSLRCQIRVSSHWLVCACPFLRKITKQFIFTLSNSQTVQLNLSSFRNINANIQINKVKYYRLSCFWNSNDEKSITYVNLIFHRHVWKNSHPPQTKRIVARIVKHPCYQLFRVKQFLRQYVFRNVLQGYLLLEWII